MKKTILTAAVALLAFGILTGCDTYELESTGGYYDTLKVKCFNKTDFKITWDKNGTDYTEVAYEKDSNNDSHAKVLAHSTEEGRHIYTCKLTEVRSTEVQYKCDGNGLEPLIMRKDERYNIFLWYDLGSHKEAYRSIMYTNGELLTF